MKYKYLKSPVNIFKENANVSSSVGLVLIMVLWRGQVDVVVLSVERSRCLALLYLLSWPRMKSDTVKSSAWREGCHRCSVIPDVCTPARAPEPRHPAHLFSSTCQRAEAFSKNLRCSSNIPTTAIVCHGPPIQSRVGDLSLIKACCQPQGPQSPTQLPFEERKNHTTPKLPPELDAELYTL